MKFLMLIVKLIFIWPCKTLLLIEYYFPYKGQVISSGRRKNRVFFQVMGSIFFWIFSFILWNKYFYS